VKVLGALCSALDKIIQQTYKDNIAQSSNTPRVTNHTAAPTHSPHNCVLILLSFIVPSISHCCVFFVDIVIGLIENPGFAFPDILEQLILSFMKVNSSSSLEEK
jgi:hypothetical protein